MFFFSWYFSIDSNVEFLLAFIANWEWRDYIAPFNKRWWLFDSILSACCPSGRWMPWKMQMLTDLLHSLSLSLYRDVIYRNASSKEKQEEIHPNGWLGVRKKIKQTTLLYILCISHQWMYIASIMNLGQKSLLLLFLTRFDASPDFLIFVYFMSFF